MRNRRAESMLVDFWAILIFAIICIIILIIILVSRNVNTQKISEEFSNKDVNLMLNSFLRAPYSSWDGPTMANIIAEDSITKDYTRTKEVFEKYFSGVDVYSDNPVGGYVLGIDDDAITFLNLNNKKFIEQVGESKLLNSIWVQGGFVPIPIGMISKTFNNQNINSIKYQKAQTTIPRIDGQDVKVSVIIIYDEKYNEKFS